MGVGTPSTLRQNFKAMEVIFILIALSLLVAGGFLGAFLWAVRSGQYDDDHTPAMRILFDDKPAASTETKDAQTPTEKLADQ